MPRRPNRGVRTDGGLFAVTDRPVVAHTTGTDDETGTGDPTVTAANRAFVETFGVTDEVTGVALSTTLASITAAGFDERELVENARRGRETTAAGEAETVDGTRLFEMRTVRADGTGYVIFSDVGVEDSPEVVEYLTHSLRNPLEVARVHAELVEADGSEGEIGTVLTALERIEAIIADTKELLRQRPTAETAAPVDVAAVARDAWATAWTANATLSVGSPGTVEADERQLRVLFENLFRNAVRHGTAANDQDGGELTVTVDGMARGFFVADDGAGIPAGDREQVLDLGYTTASDGTGLGLTIVAEIADSHGWAMAVTESDGGGSRFEFTS
jgi:signal transduction histidine kinase